MYDNAFSLMLLWIIGVITSNNVKIVSSYEVCVYGLDFTQSKNGWAV